MSRFIRPVTQAIERGWSETHFGIDYRSPVGTPVLASGDGRVVFAGTDVPGGTFGAIAGKVIGIDHGEVWTEYAHLSVINVSVGQTVKQGQVIGLSGATGVVTGAHLHFGFIGEPINWKNGSLGRLNPDLYLNEGEVMNITTFNSMYLRYCNRYPRPDEVDNQFNKVSVDDLALYLEHIPEGIETDKAQEVGYKALSENWEEQIKNPKGFHSVGLLFGVEYFLPDEIKK